MNLRYRFLLVIPAFFVLGSCAGTKTLPDGFLTFSSEQKEEASIPEKHAEIIKKKAAKAEDTVKKDVKQDAEHIKEIEQESAQPAITESEEEKIEGEKIIKRYNMGYLTFNVADFYAELIPIEKHDDYTEYKFRFYSKTNGFVDYVFGWMSYTASTMKVYKNKVVPETFKSKITLKKKTKEIDIDYDDSGRITHEIVIPPDNRGKRPAVDDKLKIGTLDPLSIVIETRRIVMDTFRTNNFNDKGMHNFKLPLYDGRKKTEVNFELKKEKAKGLYHLKFTQKPIAGYTNNELKDIAKGERVIELFIDPETFTPVFAQGSSPLGQARAKWMNDCTVPLEACIKQSAKNNKDKKN
jgi:hypothetical protein